MMVTLKKKAPDLEKDQDIWIQTSFTKALTIESVKLRSKDKYLFNRYAIKWFLLQIYRIYLKFLISSIISDTWCLRVNISFFEVYQHETG